MIDATLIQQRLALIGGLLQELERLSRVPKADFPRDKDKTAATESYLRRSLEAIFDVGRHILAKTGSVDLAGEYKSIARGLAENGVVDEALGHKLVEMAGYRNRLVHLYNEITAEEMYTILATSLDDIRDFVRRIRDYVGGK